MNIYHIKNEYINFLKQYDEKIYTNKNEKRPYIGVVVEADGIKYYAPLTSPKPKHAKMKNAVDFRKISNGRYGAINFSNMIPVPDCALIPISINDEPDDNYRVLLQGQYFALQYDAEAIIQTATKLREIVTSDDKKLSPYNLQIKQRCCNLSLLESVYMNFEA